MELRTLSHDFKLTGVIDGVRSLKYSECFRDAGELYVCLEFTKERYELLKPPARILVGELLYTIEKISCNETEIRAWGVGIFAEFKQKYISKPIEINTSPSQALFQLAEQMTFDGISYNVYGISGEEASMTLVYDWCTDYYSIINQLCYDCGFGFRLLYSPETKRLSFFISRVADRATPGATTYTVISDKRDTYTSIESFIDVSNYKTKIEFVYRINSIDELESFVYDKTAFNEQERGCAEYPRIIAQSRKELTNALDALAKKRFREYRKKRYFKAHLRADPAHEVGHLCIVESDRLGEMAYVVLTERIVEINDTGSHEALLLEVQE